jgi:hypothetical protein
VNEEREDGERGEREGEGTQALSLSSGTHRIHNSLAEHADRFPVVELREPRNLCVCVIEDLGHGEGAGAHAILPTDTRRRVVSLAENARLWVMSRGDPPRACLLP